MINKKRQDLENFIREQTLGPGVMGARFIDLKDQKEIATGTETSLIYSSELINTAPATVYSTGILFPVDDTKMGALEKKPAEKEEEEQETQRTTLPTLPDDSTDQEEPGEEENINIDSQSLNQMYPNSIGLTVCLGPKVIQDNDLEIFISARYYSKIDLKDTDLAIGVRLEQEKSLFETFLDELPVNDIIRTHVLVGATKESLPYIYLEGNATIAQDLKKRLYAIKAERATILGVGETRAYKSLDDLKEGLFNELRMSVPPQSAEGKKKVDKLRSIEIIENSLSHIQDLISIYDSSSYGIWKCETFEHRIGQELPIPVEFVGKHVYSQKSEPALANIHRIEYAKDKWASLGVNLQYSKYEREKRTGNNLFLKVQLINTSKHFSETDTRNGKNYFSMASEEVNNRSFFDVGIRVKSRSLLPYRSPNPEEKKEYSEEDVNAYIYRQFKDHGLGHGCSVCWGEKEGVPFVSTQYIPMYETPDVDPIPRYKRAPMEKHQEDYSPRPVFSDTRFLQFKWLSTLSETSDQELLNGLREFARAYEKWIEEQQDKEQPGIASHIRELCREDQIRMLSNIEILLSKNEGLLCFRLMNTAMFMQLWHAENVKKGAVNGLISNKDFKGFFESFYKQDADDRIFSLEESAAWRPFQLAFILLNLDSIFQRPDDPEWLARNELVDLVWFPTGGGKTEAYLGLIALTILNRRRTFKEHGGGTAVLMRYTLRLLTTQQFQRATLLIMALELIRRWRAYDLGEEPIYIGLFVGQGSLPNKLTGDKSLQAEYTKLAAAQSAGKATRSKIPLRKCPWCGHDLNPINFYEETSGGPFAVARIFLACSRKDKACAFSTEYPFPLLRQDQGPIPVSLCDEEIYQHPPALLFGTVDKFAQIAHKISKKTEGRHNDSRRLFGKGNWENGKPSRGYLPPDLIIQDELHLMMGPLGSAVALFESAIDQLCTREENGKKVRPKVISSTATTRNTPLQIMALFDRKVNLFPKPGINCDDSFFAFYKRIAKDEQGNGIRYSSKRKYIGILPTGRTQMWMQLRLAAILFTHRAIFEKEILGTAYPFDADAYPPEAIKTIDYYHTVLAYFNSLREVGKTESQIYSYLVKEIRRVFNKVIRPDKLMHCFYTYNSSFHNGELTGRLSGEEVVGQMERISNPWSPKKRLAHGTPPEVKKGTVPPDLVISTNMISVGIDISRFNCMIMNCMPRNIAEYIQASSRVARDKPGLVITIHHPFRSRDISHYERFIEFHEKMYSYVEPISITPFTRKALKRYLPLYIATIIRHRAGYEDRTAANIHLDEYERERLQRRLVDYFKARMEHLQKMTGIEEVIKRLLTEENLQHIDDLVNEALDAWQKEYANARAGGIDLVFNYQSQKKTRPQRQLYVDIDEYQDNISSELWRIPQSLRVVDPEAVIHVKQK